MSFEKPIFDYAKLQEDLCRKNDIIPNDAYETYNVKRGLRDINGDGVPAGLTNISYITASRKENGVRKPHRSSSETGYP